MLDNESDVTKHFVTETCCMKMESVRTFRPSKHTGMLEIRDVYKFCKTQTVLDKMSSINISVLLKVPKCT